MGICLAFIKMNQTAQPWLKLTCFGAEDGALRSNPGSFQASSRAKTRQLASCWLTNQKLVTRHNNQRIHNNRKGPTFRPLFFTSKSATVFLMDMIQTSKAYFHRILWILVESIHYLTISTPRYTELHAQACGQLQQPWFEDNKD